MGIEKNFMDIPVIGNGFDLAHDLLTKYGDFFEFWIESVHSKRKQMLNCTNR